MYRDFDDADEDGTATPRDWKAFEVRWKRHRRRNVRVRFFTWRSFAYCHEKGEPHTFVKVLFPDGSGGYKVCEKCGHTYGIGEY
jgi:hypothetical protein